MKILRIFIAFCAAAVLGIAAIIVGACGANGAFGGIMSISELTKDNVKEGLIVEGEIYGVWDEFAVHEKEEDGETITLAGYYSMVMPYSYDYEETPIFIGISSTIGDEIAGLDQMRGEVEDIINEESASDVYTKMNFRGKITRLDGEKLTFFKKSVAQLLAVSEDDVANYVVPYVIESYNGSSYTPLLIAGIAVTIIGVAGVMIMFIKDIGEEN